MGDVSGQDAQSAPSWADVTGADIVVHDQQATIVLTLAGDVPDATADGEFVSIGTFHDITGDGYIDREVWAAGSADGWGTSFWNNDDESVAFGAEDDVDLELHGRQVRLTFPASHLDDVRTGRWQVTLEWVEETLLSERLAVDDAPDDRSGATWGP